MHILAALAVLHPLGLVTILALLGIGLLGLNATVGPLVPLGSLGAQAVAALGGGPLTPIAASGAINPHQPANYVITKAGVAAMTLGAPTAGADDGVRIYIVSSTAYAHTVTATGLFEDGSANVNEGTFAAHAGAALTLTAYQGKWFAQEQNVTMS
jgi:NAD(P)-dependent dehydrogenase (short-subunit alcohol dehydrogenase family)